MFLLNFKSLMSSRKAFYVEVMKSLMKTSASGNQSENYKIGNMKKFILSAIAVVAISACQLEEPHSDTIICDDDVFYAAIQDEGSSKTVLDANNNIRWSAGDQIVIFKKSSLGLKYQIQDSYVGETSGYFSKVTSASGSDDFGAGMPLEHNIAYYPYSSDVKIARSGDNYSLKIALPSEQTYVPESFANGSFPMAAVSEDTDLTFKNVCGGIKLQFTGTCKVASIRIEGKNNEKLSGAAAVIVYTDEGVPEIAMDDDASTSVTLNCGDGVLLNESTPTEFIISLPPTIFTQGFTVTVTDIYGGTQTIETSKANEVKRTTLLTMQEVEVEIVRVPQDGDYIDEYGVNHGQGVKIGETVWAPVNCGYHKDDFKYGKLYQWGRKYGQGYEGSLYDLSGKNIGTYSDATLPIVEESPVSVAIGNDESNANVIYASSDDYDWVNPDDDKLWNSGTEENPVKTDYDPCPEGWRVPTYEELDRLLWNKSSWTTGSFGHAGYWLSGASPYTSDAPQVFIPAAGGRFYYGSAGNRGNHAYYWSSMPSSNSAAACLRLYSGNAHMSTSYRAGGFSVRCVKDSNVAERVVVDLSEEGTANSYIISKDGVYKFTPVKAL